MDANKIIRGLEELKELKFCDNQMREGRRKESEWHGNLEKTDFIS